MGMINDQIWERLNDEELVCEFDKYEIILREQFDW